jgi:cellulose synthase/poly-beta-1,6-N-acetylglucosamine synthase-like glycosyltransferase
MSENPLVSIIIPCKKIDDYAKECVKFCNQLDYGNFEIILLPDDAEEKVEGARIIASGPATPGVKRNIGIANSKGEICAFIDSDAYPRRDWLSNAIKYFDDPKVAGVGGPGLTPREDSVMQKASGHILSSFMVGSLSSRYRAEHSFESDDVHSCNFVARKDVLKEVGGWNEEYWPGEDTLMCLAIKKHGKKLVEASDVVVYHHRRPLFAPHLKQVSRFGLHRGFFAKRFKGNSFRLTYFMPSLLLLSLFAGGLTAFFNSFFVNVLLLISVAYLLSCLIAALVEAKPKKLALLVCFGIMATHFVYGLSFLAGFMKRDLPR